MVCVCTIDKEKLIGGGLLQGMAFTREERQVLGIHGMLPAVVKTDAEQVQHCLLLLERCANDLDRYIYLMGLLDRNEQLFFQVLSQDVASMMPLVYTPTVGEACQKFSLVYHQPKGMFINIYDKGHVYDVLKVKFVTNWIEKILIPSRLF